MTFEAFFINFILLFNYFVIYYFLAVNGIYGLLSIVAGKELFYYLKRIAFGEHEELVVSPLTPPISVIVPAYNEELTIVSSVQAILGLRYPEFEVIVVNDGSGDGTLQSLVKAFGLCKTSRVVHKKIDTREVKGTYESLYHANLLVIDKARGGKSDALNAGINASRFPLVCSVDADSLLEEDALLRAVKPFIEKPDKMVASGGIVRIANGCEITGGKIAKVRLPKKAISIIQVIEYLRAFLVGRLGWSSLNNLLLISGAFGLFKKEAVINVGGYKTDTVGEDLELVLALHENYRSRNLEYDIKFVPDPVCWTQAPDSLAALRKQRERWHLGLMNSLFRHKKMLFNPKFGSIGLFGLPYYWFFEMLGPLVEFAGYIIIPLSIYFGIINLQFFLLFLLVAVLYSILISLAAVLLEEFTFKRYQEVIEIWKLFLYSIIENLCYRQLISLWRTVAFFKYLYKSQKWDVSVRKVFSEAK